MSALAEVVRRIAELGSVARAARVLGITTQAASVAWRSLEQHAGTRLLVREGSVLRITPAGTEFLARVAPEPPAGAASARAAVPLHVDVCPAELRALVLASLPCFTASRPDIRLRIRASDVAPTPWPRTLSAALRVGAHWLQRPDATLLAVYPRVACAARSLAHAGLDGVDASDSVATGLVRDLDDGDDAAATDSLDEAPPQNSCAPGAVTLATDDVDVRLAAALAGRAAAVLPLNPVVRNHLARGSLVRVLGSTRFDGLPVVLLRARATPPAFEDFVEWLRSLYRSECLHADELLQRSAVAAERR